MTEENVNENEDLNGVLEQPVEEDAVDDDTLQAAPVEEKPKQLKPLDRDMFVRLTHELEALPLPNGCLVRTTTDGTVLVNFVPGVRVHPAPSHDAPNGRSLASL